MFAVQSRLRSLFAGLVLLFLSVPSHALIPQVKEYRASGAGMFSAWARTPELACPSLAPLPAPEPPDQPKSIVLGVIPGPLCQYQYYFFSKTTNSVTFDERIVCPANSTQSGSACMCNPPFVEDPTHTSCIQNQNQCETNAGTMDITNFTLGYTAQPPEPNPNADPKVVGTENEIPWTGTLCVNGCKRTISKIENVWHSYQATSQGLYRLSADLLTVQTSEQCTTGTADAPVNPLTPPTACPGFVGQVNGKTVCVGNAAKPVNTSPVTLPPGTKPAQPGNPAAGPKPASGDGSGTGSFRTPTNGNGDNAGGSVASTVVGVGANGLAPGTTASPTTGTEQAACGAPGQPECGVKVNESGTPSTFGSSVGSDALAGAQIALDSAMAGITDKSGKDTSWGVMPQWLTAGACSPVLLMTLPAKLNSFQVNLDLCPQLPLLHILLNFLWVVWTFQATVKMVFKTTTAKG